ncbi:MAG TPA: hypothetical protein VMM38_03480 [Aridibacter sp.]|nr:hypothetical protein [Aridibacter sp.]
MKSRGGVTFPVERQTAQNRDSVDERYKNRREDFERGFSLLLKSGSPAVVSTSPSGRYEIQIDEYGPPRGVASLYSRGIVKRLSDGNEVADIKRNYGHFWHCWVAHPNGNEYLLSGEDYQGYTLVNLSRETRLDHFPEEGHDGVGFCWTAVYPSPDKLMLAVDGCIWGAPYEIRFYDFRIPDEPPYEQLGSVEGIHDADGWLDNETFSLSKESYHRKSDGASYDELSKDDQREIEKDWTLAEIRIVNLNVSRPKL